MPNHCFNSENYNPLSTYVSDFSVNFNSDVSNQLNYPASFADSTIAVNSTLCDSGRTDNTHMIAGNNYSEYD